MIRYSPVDLCDDSDCTSCYPRNTAALAKALKKEEELAKKKKKRSRGQIQSFEVRKKSKK